MFVLNFLPFFVSFCFGNHFDRVLLPFLKKMQGLWEAGRAPAASQRSCWSQPQLCAVTQGSHEALVKVGTEA